MNGINKVELLGNITDAPKVGKTKTGTSYAQFTVAVNEDYRNPATGETVKKVTYVDVACFGNQANNCGKFLGRGARVLVNGKIRVTTFEAKDGTKRTAWDVLADNGGVLFLDGRGKAADTSAPEVKAAAGD